MEGTGLAPRGNDLPSTVQAIKMAKDYTIDKVDKLNPAIYDRDPKNPGRKFVRLVAGENGFQAGEVIDQRVVSGSHM